MIKKLFIGSSGAVGLGSSPRRSRGRLAAFAAASAVALVISALISPVAAEARAGGAEITPTTDLTQLSPAEMAAAVPVPTKPVDSGRSILKNWDPRTSPAARGINESQDASNPSCYTGYVCQKVQMWNCHYGEDCRFREFLFYDYGLYSVYEWTGIGVHNNRQTGGASYRFYGSDGRQIDCVNGLNIQDLDPVYYVRLSATPC